MPSNSEEVSDCDDGEDIFSKSVREKRHVNRICDSDSEEESSCTTSKIELNENETVSVTEHVSSSEIDSANKSDEEDVYSGKLVAKTLDAEEDRLYVNDEFTNQSSEKHSSKKGKGAPRKSKLNALEEIHSESQRMIRESRVSLPYHRPKQRSLADFLNRRKSLTVVPLKSAKEKLTEVWQQIEQREKMAEKFFDSDTDDSDADVKDEVSGEKNVKTESNSSVCNDLITTDAKENNSSSPKIEDDSICLDKIHENSMEELKMLDKSSLNDVEEINLKQSVNGSSETVQSDCNQTLSDSVPGEDTNTEDSNQIINQDKKIPKVLSSIDIFAESQEVILDTSDVEGSSQSNKTSITNVLKHKLNLISEETLNIVPKISGSSDDIIDFDDNLPKIKGTASLMKRFMKHVSLQPGKFAKKEEMNIIASEVNDKGEIINITEETVSVLSVESKLPNLGQKLGLLKASLQQKISQSREQQLAKKVQEYRLYEDELEPEDKLENDDDADQEEEEEIDLTETETESEPEEDDVIENRKEKKVKNPFVEEEAEVSDDDTEVATEELSDDENILETKETSKPNNVLEDFKGTQDDDAINNLLDLCSGNFTSQPLNLNELEEPETNDSHGSDIEASDSEEKVDNEILEDSDSDEESVVAKKRKTKKKVYISDDDEDGENQVEQSVQDYDSENVCDNVNADVISELSQEQDDLQSVSEDNASNNEENLVEDEEDELARKITKEFLDGEAELSGSDWDSADEDERELDDLEEELGDEDKISERKLQKELGKIHFKEIMAEDKREVRLLQELLLEDGELHSDGPKRQRDFRWYNDDDGNLGPDRYVEGEDGESHVLPDEDDETWRRSRTEREKFLREKNIDNLEDLRNSLDASALNIGKSVIKTAPKISQNILKSPDPKLQFKLVNKRGSFLNRSEKILNKLAQISTSIGLNENPIGSSKGKKNMVFAVVSPPKLDEKVEIPEEKKMTLKRKSDLLVTPPVKKIRFSSDTNVAKKRFSLLEQLKQSDMT